MSYTLEIVQDTDPSNPREEFDQASRFVCFHRRYNLGDKHAYRSEDYDGWDGLEKQLAKDGAAVILPLFLLDHSGLALSTQDFNDRWDSGQIGFAYMTRQGILDNFMAKRLSPFLRDRALALIKGEVEEYNCYLSGDVYGYAIKDGDGETVDSCWGFYGYKYAEEQGREALASFNNPQEREAA
jgi:hypothetical protein